MCNKNVLYLSLSNLRERIGCEEKGSGGKVENVVLYIEYQIQDDWSWM